MTFPKTIQRIKQGLAAGDFTACQLLDHVFGCISQRDEKINAFISLNKEAALDQAKACDARGYGPDAPLLNGVPIAIKDNILTQDMKTTAASKMLADFLPSYDARVVTLLKEAGAILVGKTNLDEFAMGSSTESSYFGKTLNPWDFTRVPGGSSGGSAAAVASRQVPAALGTDTGGSIRQPAAFTGIVGMKPSYGTVSRLGGIAFASSLDQIGPMTLTVADNALVLSAIAGHDLMDATSQAGLGLNYSAKLEAPLKGLRLAYPEEFRSDAIDPEIRQRMDDVVAFFEGQGAQVDSVSLPMTAYGVYAYYIISSAEAASNLQRFDGIRYGYRSESAKTLEEIYILSRTEGFGEEVKRRIMVGTHALGSGNYDRYFYKAAQVRTLIKEEYSQVFQEYDAIIGPATTSTAFELGDRQEDPLKNYMADLLTVPVNLAGLPALAIPMGFDSKGLPMGLQVIGRAYDEATLYQIGHQYEIHHPYHEQAPVL